MFRVIYNIETRRIKTAGFIAADHPVPEGFAIASVDVSRIPAGVKFSRFIDGKIVYDPTLEQEKQESVAQEQLIATRQQEILRRQAVSELRSEGKIKAGVR